MLENELCGESPAIPAQRARLAVRRESKTPDEASPTSGGGDGRGRPQATQGQRTRPSLPRSREYTHQSTSSR
eukprot:6121819-Pleurochrysis_carterae.AAC.1